MSTNTLRNKVGGLVVIALIGILLLLAAMPSSAQNIVFDQQHPECPDWLVGPVYEVCYENTGYEVLPHPAGWEIRRRGDAEGSHQFVLHQENFPIVIDGGSHWLLIAGANLYGTVYIDFRATEPVWLIATEGRVTVFGDNGACIYTRGFESTVCAVNGKIIRGNYATMWRKWAYRRLTGM